MYFSSWHILPTNHHNTQPMNNTIKNITLINFILLFILLTFKLNASAPNRFNFRGGNNFEKNDCNAQFKSPKFFLGSQFQNKNYKSETNSMLLKSKLGSTKKIKPTLFNKILSSDLKLIFRISKNMNLVITYN